MNKLIIIVVLVVAIGVAAFFVVGSKEAQAPSEFSLLEDFKSDDAMDDGIDNTEEQANESGTTEDEVLQNTGTEADDTANDIVVAPTTQTHQMILGPNGYEPRNITISRGDTIVFSTTEGSPFWPASNVHPTHRILPAFDPKSPTKPGKTYSFTFNEAGEWPYHDHLAPFHSGTITVIGR